MMAMQPLIAQHKCSLLNGGCCSSLLDLVQLCRGASAEERQRYLLPASLESFAYLNTSGCTSIAGVDDAAGFADVKAALAAVGIPPEQQDHVFSILAAVLWLGNIRFSPLHDDAVTVDAASMPALRSAASLLAVEEAALLAALTTRRMQAAGEVITCELGMEAALDNRDALSKAIYAALFKWLVHQVGKKRCGCQQAAGRSLVGQAVVVQVCI